MSNPVKYTSYKTGWMLHKYVCSLRLSNQVSIKFHNVLNSKNMSKKAIIFKCYFLRKTDWTFQRFARAAQKKGRNGTNEKSDTR